MPVSALPKASRGHSPDRVADIIGDKQRARLVDGDADGATARVTFVVEEAGDDILRFAARLAARERHEHDLISVERAAIPASMLTDESAATIFLRQALARVEGKTERRDMRG